MSADSLGRLVARAFAELGAPATTPVTERVAL
jgi:hypothetical protein